MEGKLMKIEAGDVEGHHVVVMTTLVQDAWRDLATVAQEMEMRDGGVVEIAVVIVVATVLVIEGVTGMGTEVVIGLVIVVVTGVDGGEEATIEVVPEIPEVRQGKSAEVLQGMMADHPWMVDRPESRMIRGVEVATGVAIAVVIEAEIEAENPHGGLLPSKLPSPLRDKRKMMAGQLYVRVRR